MTPRLILGQRLRLLGREQVRVGLADELLQLAAEHRAPAPGEAELQVLPEDGGAGALERLQQPPLPLLQPLDPGDLAKVTTSPSITFSLSR